jgi:hypothetical protein
VPTFNHKTVMLIASIAAAIAATVATVAPASAGILIAIGS